MPLSENIEGTTAHFILNSIHCCSRTSFSPLSTSSPLQLPPCWGARQHVPQTFCQSSVAHPTQAELSFLSRCCCCCCWSCKQIAQFFLGFLLLFPFFFVLCFCLLYLPLPLAACRCPAEAINVLSCQRSAAAAVRNCYGQKRNSAGATASERGSGEEGRGGGMGKVKSGKWKNPMRKNAKSICCAR